MRWSSLCVRAGKIVGVIALAVVMAACSRQAPAKQFGLGGEGPATPGTGAQNNAFPLFEGKPL